MPDAYASTQRPEADGLPARAVSDRTTLRIEDAQSLAQDSMTACGYALPEAEVIAEHLIDAELRGLGYGGLARAISIVERLRNPKLERRPIRVAMESPASAQIDGGNQAGMLVARRATELAIDKARRHGLAAVGASRTWLTGMFSHYLERITAAGQVGIIAGSGPKRVAPHGGNEARLCTNPIAFGFPSLGAPVIFDTGTSAILWQEVENARRFGLPLPEGLAFNAEGHFTTVPSAALQGAFSVWGGHRGSGLSISIQLLGVLAGQTNASGPAADCGFFVTVVDPALFGNAADFRSTVSAYADELRSTRPLDAAAPVRVPFERSTAERERRVAAGTIEVDTPVVLALRAACDKRTP